MTSRPEEKQDQEATKRNWTVTARGRRFSMGGEAMTYAEALHAVRAIFSEGEVE